MDSPTDEPVVCARHPDQWAVQRCCVCSKPICARCMELFGYVCSPLCKARAVSHGIQVPVFAGQRSEIEARSARRFRLGIWLLMLLVAGVIGCWIWYTVASKPKVIFSVRFPQPAYSGQSAMPGPQQIVFLHGPTLARYDMRENKEVWSLELLDHNQVGALAAKRMQAFQAAAARTEDEDTVGTTRLPSMDTLMQRAEQELTSQLALHVSGTNVWVSSPERLVRYDWQTGKAAQEFQLDPRHGRVVTQGSELLLLDNSTGQPLLSRIDMSTCETKIEPLGGMGSGRSQGNQTENLEGPAGRLPYLGPKPLDPARAAEQVRQMSLPARLALPAILAARMNQERAMAELSTQGRRPQDAPPPPKPDPDSVSLIPTADGFVRFSQKLVEARIVEREAMKPTPARSAFQGMPSVGKSPEMINETLNEMQRERGGGKVYDDLSRYRVTLRAVDGDQQWSGEVVGPPALFALQTVKVLAAGSTITVFDKSNNRLWDATLTYKVRSGATSPDPASAPYGLGPCVERNGVLYVIDDGVLTAFDLATGNARWRYPSIGIVGLLFDEKGMLYVNTTTATPDQIKYARQIDVSQSVGSVVLKLDPRTGTTLWTAQPGGMVSYVSGKFLYTVAFFSPDDEDQVDAIAIPSENGPSPWLRISRLDPRTGRAMWEYTQERAPLDVQFDKNTIRLVFKKEVLVLRFFSF